MLRSYFFLFFLLGSITTVGWWSEQIDQKTWPQEARVWAPMVPGDSSVRAPASGSVARLGEQSAPAVSSGGDPSIQSRHGAARRGSNQAPLEIEALTVESRLQ